MGPRYGLPAHSLEIVEGGHYSPVVEDSLAAGMPEEGTGLAEVAGILLSDFQWVANGGWNSSMLTWRRGAILLWIATLRWRIGHDWAP